MYSKLNGLTFEQDLKRFEPEDFIEIPTVLREKNTKHKKIGVGYTTRDVWKLPPIPRDVRTQG